MNLSFEKGFTSTEQYNKAICQIPLLRANLLTKYYQTHHHLPYGNFFDTFSENEKALYQLTLSFAIGCENTKQYGTHLPLYTLIQQRHLSKFIVHAIMCAIAWEIEPTFSKKVLAIPPFQKTTSMTLEMLFALYYICNPLEAEKNLLEECSHYFNLFFKRKSPSSQDNIHIEEDVLSFLLGQNKTEHFSFEKMTFSLTSEHSFSKELSIYVGKKGIGKKHCIQEEAKKKNKNLIFCSFPTISTYSQKFWENISQTIIRHAILWECDICLCDIDITNTNRMDRLLYFIKTLHHYEISVLLTAISFIPPEIQKNFYSSIKTLSALSEEEQKKLLTQSSLLSIEEANEISDYFHFTPKQIDNVLKEIAFHHPKTKKELFQICFSQSGAYLETLAKSIPASFTWENLVLPSELIENIKKSCMYIKKKNKVYKDWGFSKRLSYGQGLNILFAGPPGTGKTMLSQVIANELDMALFQIDLSTVVSKYIGETEENIAKIFDEAQNGSCVLFFDEMDALFGKRSETQDAKDKYANMETAYLLQRLEYYNGVVLMATNYLSNIDEAFMRRIHFLFHIPFPNQTLRLSLWKKSFPKNTPLANDIDFDFLSKTFELTGSSIKNIALSAAFYAAYENIPITMSHIIKALTIELRKQNKTLLKEDLGLYYYLMEKEDL